MSSEFTVTVAVSGEQDVSCTLCDADIPAADSRVAYATDTPGDDQPICLTCVAAAVEQFILDHF